MSRRITFSTYGAGARELNEPAYAVRLDPCDSGAAVVARAIARKNGLVVVNYSNAGYDPQVKRQHYQVTLGKPARFGGYDIIAQFWITLPSGHMV